MNKETERSTYVMALEVYVSGSGDISYLAFFKEGILFTHTNYTQPLPPPMTPSHLLEWLRVLLHSYLIRVL